MRIALLLLVVLASGCASLGRAPASAPAQAEPATARSPAPAIASRGEVAAKSEAGQAKPAAKTTPSPAPAAPAPRKEGAPPVTAKQAAAPAMDLASLEKRLKETDAIGVLTKIKLKNEIDDLLERFRAYYQGRLATTLAELRPPFETLFLKVLSLIQDSDPALARSIAASREAIWSFLSDRSRFATL